MQMRVKGTLQLADTKLILGQPSKFLRLCYPNY